MKAGYSLLEVLVAIFILTGVVLACFSVLENGSRAALKQENQMVAVSLAEHISEQLHAMPAIVPRSDISFPPPFGAYLYSVSFGAYDDGNFNWTKAPQKITVYVKRPSSAFISLSMILARQPYVKP